LEVDDAPARGGRCGRVEGGNLVCREYAVGEHGVRARHRCTRERIADERGALEDDERDGIARELDRVFEIEGAAQRGRVLSRGLGAARFGEDERRARESTLGPGWDGE